MNSEALQLPTIDALEQRTDELEARNIPGVSVRTLGKSRNGRDVRMISMGEGNRSVLVLGVPHPNEPVGALTCEFLISQWLQDPDFGGSDITWHFIKAIDPEGLRLNEAWCTQPLSLGNYMEHHFRPALKNQPEYSFPLNTDTYQFNEPSPENLCWQQALEWVKPDIQASLHHADHGGVFHVISDDSAGMANALSQLAVDSGLGVNPLGDPSVRSEPFALGVFAFPDPRQIMAQGGAGVWPAGDTGALYAKAYCDTFSITTEVPLWHDPRLLDTGPSGKTMGDVINAQLNLFESLSELLKKTVPGLESWIRTEDEREIYEAIKEWHGHADGFGAELKQAAGIIDPDAPLPTNMVALRSQLTLAAMRPAGMLKRLSADLSNRTDDSSLREVREEAGRFLEAVRSAFETDAKLESVPLDQLVKIQADSLKLAVAHKLG